MIGFLRAILVSLRDILVGQKMAADQLMAAQAALDFRLSEQAAVQQLTLDAIEHLRALIEGDDLPAIVNPPTFTPTGVIA
jgi:hypothetical protein